MVAIIGLLALFLLFVHMPGTVEKLPVDTVSERQPLHERVTEVLRTKIIDGILRPGTPVSERELCEELNVSRTPLREALKVLASENLVQLYPGRGAIVAPLSFETIDAKFTVLAALEGLAAGLACQRVSELDKRALADLHAEMTVQLARNSLADYFSLNQRFHSLIVELSGNQVLIDLQISLSKHVRRARHEAVLQRVSVEAAVAEHSAILAAILAQDPQAARVAMESHVVDVARNVGRHFRGA